MGVTHAVGGALAGAIAGKMVGDVYVGIAVGTIASLLPDIDHPKSMLGRRIPIIPSIISRIFGHRTITHSIWFCLLVGFATYLLFSPINSQIDNSYALGMAFVAFMGCLSHLVLDGLTSGGIKPFNPVKLPGPFKAFERIRGPLVTGNGMMEPLVMVVMFAGIFKVVI